ncbi:MULTISPECIES: TetR/AcrR family transcriptional regulator [Cupriavidus]|uniref:TetR/AcrR family transcriptional regulator n=1 Tax=Cupriavidus pauculus TaxID=82633 RepID=A0A5P2HE99_9BURK|nr:TetR/AcrR family transcriptional regulator [Cupriavidus pauculus]QET06352.1 TetR/AcrR family transcriptional regulator [Cupriavidus pauculus]
MPATRTSGQAGGKPKPRDAAATREKILQMAAKEFASKGYDGARVDSIVARSKISKNLVYHYFESKEALFIEVMERAYSAMRERQNQFGELGDHPVEDMRTLIVQTIRHFIDHPEFIQLLSTENLYKAEHIRKSKVIPAMFNPLRSALAQILERGKAQGLFRPDADWVDLYVSISGLGSYSISNRYTLSFVLDVDLGAKERVEARLRHVCDMVMTYLCNFEGSKFDRHAPADRALAVTRR